MLEVGLPAGASPMRLGSPCGGLPPHAERAGHWPAEPTVFSDSVSALIASRQTSSPKRLEAPAPSQSQLGEIFSSAAAAPDHGLLMPWRIVCIGEDQRAALAKAFVLALLERDTGATAEQLEAAREKAFRAPFLALVVFSPGPESAGIRAIEQVISMGCAIQNILLTAHAMGFGSGLSSGRAMTSEPIRKLFGLASSEEAACFIAIGTVVKSRAIRHRPDMQSFVSHLKAGALISPRGACDADQTRLSPDAVAGRTL